MTSVPPTGATSICLLVVIGVTSLPSVGGALSWREFRFVQSGMGWAALLTAVLHNALLGWDFMVRNYSCSMPSAQQVRVSMLGTQGGEKCMPLFPF